MLGFKLFDILDILQSVKNPEIRLRALCFVQLNAILHGSFLIFRAESRQLLSISIDEIGIHRGQISIFLPYFALALS